MKFMKVVCYVTKKRIWAGDKEFVWDGVSFDEVVGKIKKDLKVDGMRVVFGNDVSYVTAVKVDQPFPTRESVLKMIKPWMPFEVDNDCFDWKEVVLARDEVWIQIVALEKGLLLSLSSAVLKNNVKVRLVTSIGVLLAKKTIGREAPAVLKWSGKENLLVLAVNGLADLVVSSMAEEDLMVYAKQKWQLAVNPEEIFLNEKYLNLSNYTFSEKTKGEDKSILNLPILKEIIMEDKQEEIINNEPGYIGSTQMEVKKSSSGWIYMIILLVMIAVSILVYKLVFSNRNVAIEAEVTPTPTEIITPEPTKQDLSLYKVQVLNGSEITGEAAKIKTSLVADGFVSVDTGNTTATTETTIKTKTEISQSVVDIVMGNLEDYKIGTSGALLDGDKYDIVVVIGSMK